MSTTTPFEDLLRAAQLGEGAAFAELWARFSGGVAGFVRARGAVDVDEITNDVFLAAFRSIGGFLGDQDGFKALLFTIARRRVTDEHRRRGRRVQSVAWSPFDDGPSIASVEDHVVERDDSRELVGWLDVLTADQRDVILLRLLADLPIEHVARVLGKRPGTIKSLQRRGLDSLRRSMLAAPRADRPEQTALSARPRTRQAPS